MYECDSWTIKKAELCRPDAFELWCWRRLLRVPWTARRSNHSFLKEINAQYSLEGLRLKLKLQYFGTRCEELIHLKRPWFWERLKAGGEGDDRGWAGWMVSLTRWTWVWVNSGSWWWTGRPGVLCVVHGVPKNQRWLSDWTELKCEVKLKPQIFIYDFQILKVLNTHHFIISLQKTHWKKISFEHT